MDNFGIDVAVVDGTGLAPYADNRDLAVCALRETVKFRRVYQGFHAGWVGHILTMAHALIALDEMGYHELAWRGHLPHRLLVRQAALLHDLPGEGLVAAQPVEVSPLAAEFWDGDYAGNAWAFGHTFKYPLSYFAMRGSIEDASELARIDAAVRFIWN